MRLVTAWVLASYALVALGIIAMAIYELWSWLRRRSAVRRFIESADAPDPMELLSLGRDPEDPA